MAARSIRITAAAFVLASLLMASGCAVLPETARPDGGDAGATPTPTTEPDSSAPGSGSDGGTADALVEREEFFVEQQQIPGSGELVARTDAQIELVRRQREHVEAQGIVWASGHESLTLALALDACETSILNGHDVDVTIFETHVASSPLFSSLAEDDTASRRGLADIMVYGTGFLCPEDAPQWEAAAAESTL